MTTDYSLQKEVEEWLRLGALMKELIEDLGEEVAKMAFQVIIAMLLSAGVAAAQKLLKNQFNLDVDKTVLEEAMRATKRKA